MKKWILLLALLLVVTGVAQAIPDPSAWYCTLQGYDLEVRTDEQGNQYGVCVFPDGSECGTWAYYCKCEPNGIGCWLGDFNCHWPCEEMRCKEAGESVLVSKCCEGLDEIYPAHIFDANCNNLGMVGWLFLCSDCGNGFCESWESRCNCPEDCAQPCIIYVDADANGLNDGSSWTDAFNNLQDALAFALPSDEIRVAEGTYKPTWLPPVPPEKAINPSPADGSTDISITADLSWTAGDGAVSHDVYFGTTSLGIFQGNQTNTTFDPGTMGSGIKYYWRIDEVGSWSTSTGVVWSFTTFPGPTALALSPLGADSAEDTTISPHSQSATFVIKNGIVIKGGYAGFGEPNPDARNLELYETILSGDLAGNDRDVNDPYDLLSDPCRADNCYHVVTAIEADYYGKGPNTILDGFTITGGNANGSYLYDQDTGGGIYNEYGCLTITNCTFKDNSAKYGGGMYNYDSSPTLTNCIFSGNLAEYAGGGMYNYEGDPTLTNCTFINNSGEDGGGIFCYETSLTLTNCTFSGNLTNEEFGPPDMLTEYALSNGIASAGLSGSGGGIECSKSSATLTNCTFTGNLAGDGGAIDTHGSTLTLNNCTFSGNFAEYGGGMRTYQSNVTLISCTFSGNSADQRGVVYNRYARSSPILTNCILWDDTPEEIYDDDSTTVVTYSNVQGGWGGEGNIDADPCFVDSGYWDANGIWIEGDYHLLPDSPCIDTGDPNYVAEPNETDLDGKPRVIGGRIDMGAYEYIPPISAEVRFIPRTISLASKGKWIAAFIRLPKDYNVAEIDPNSVFLENEIKPALFRLTEDQQIAIAKFNREKVQAILSIGKAELTITGRLPDRDIFEATDFVRVTSKSRGKFDKYIQASDPIPPDGAISVRIDASLSWTPGPYVTSHDVYFGTISYPPFVCNQTSTTFDPCTMAYGTTYYWRIDEVNKWSTTTGELWHFTTFKPPPPQFKAYDPNPAYWAINVSIIADLRWKAGSDATSHDVYFGTSIPLPFVCNQTNTTFEPGPMEYETTYYWRIDEVNMWGKNIGDVWAFTTYPLPPQ